MNNPSPHANILNTINEARGIIKLTHEENITKYVILGEKLSNELGASDTEEKLYQSFLSCLRLHYTTAIDFGFDMLHQPIPAFDPSNVNPPIKETAHKANLYFSLSAMLAVTSKGKEKQRILLKDLCGCAIDGAWGSCIALGHSVEKITEDVLRPYRNVKNLFTNFSRN